VVGADGTVLFTMSGGLSWTEYEKFTDITLRDASFTDQYTGAVVGDLGAILRQEENVETAVLITGFRARPMEHGIELGWSLFADEPIDGFQLYRSGCGYTIEHAINERLIDASERRYVDTTALPGNCYRYTLVVFGAESGVIRSAPVEVGLVPRTAQLFPNHPNPFNPATTIRYVVPRPTHVTLQVFSPAGQLVRTLVDRSLHSGTQEVTWDGTNEKGERVASGVYICRLRVDKATMSQKMILLK